MYDPSDYTIDNEGDEYVTRVVVDVCARAFYVHSNEGVTRSTQSETPDGFIRMLSKLRDIVPEELIVYNEPLFI